MIVVDTNTISYLFLTGEFSDQAERALLKDSLWSAPLLWRSEFRSVLAQYIRKNILTLDQALEIMESAVSLMETNEYDVDSKQVLDLANNSNLSAYDCEFVALAKALGVKLVTVDKKVLEHFSDYAISIQEFAD